MNTMSKVLSVQKISLQCPSLSEVATVLQAGMTHDFAEVNVEVVDCPDLRRQPFSLACQGLCGKPRIADVGGSNFPYTVPLIQKEKIYNLDDLAELSELPGTFCIGAGAGPSHELGLNAEYMANVDLAEGGANRTYMCRQDPSNGRYILERCNSKETNLIMHLFLSEGKTGQVLKLAAKRRLVDRTLINSIQTALHGYYGDRIIALGGTFVMESGKASVHVMPHFAATPFTSEEEERRWVKPFEMQAPLTSIGCLLSHKGDLDLHTAHFHCFSSHGDGGHFQFDKTPDEVSYVAYLGLAEDIYRIDKPN